MAYTVKMKKKKCVHRFHTCCYALNSHVLAFVLHNLDYNACFILFFFRLFGLLFQFLYFRECMHILEVSIRVPQSIITSNSNSSRNEEGIGENSKCKIIEINTNRNALSWHKNGPVQCMAEILPIRRSRLLGQRDGWWLNYIFYLFTIRSEKGRRKNCWHNFFSLFFSSYFWIWPTRKILRSLHVCWISFSFSFVLSFDRRVMIVFFCFWFFTFWKVNGEI